jgi:hypothetical protein
MHSASLIPLVFSAAVMAAQVPNVAPNDLVRKVISNEIRVDEQDHSHWMYQIVSNVPEPETSRTVVETSHGDINYTEEIDHRPLSPEQRSAEDEKVKKFVDDPDLQRKARESNAEDDKKSEEMFAILPDAFLFQYAGTDGDNQKLTFTPNPDFTSHSSEAYVFHKMDGFVIVNTKQNRLVEISGKLTHGVAFAGGLFGHLDPGGTFDVRRDEIAPGYWAITKLQVNMNGKILFFKTIAEHQDETHSHFQRVPDNTTLAQAEVMARKQIIAVAAGSR